MLTLLVPVLVAVNTVNALREETKGHPASNQRLTSKTHTEHDDKDDKQSSRFAVSTAEPQKRLGDKSSSNPHAVILGTERSIGEVPLTTSMGNDLPIENVNAPAEVLGSNTEHSKYVRTARDTAAQQNQIRMRTGQQPTSYNLTHLSAQCPYTEICDSQVKESSQRSQGSCCLPCSCDAKCGKIGTCCDKHENIGYMCHSPVVKQMNANETNDFDLGYFMVDKCLDGTNKDCTELGTAPWGPLYPVYDPVSEMIFYNPQCAECSGVTVFTNWEINLVCRGFDMNNGLIRRALQGQLNQACELRFTPPRTMDKFKHLCSDTLIDRCNVTGSWKVYNAKLEEACARWYSPMVVRTGYLKFANVCCQRCNGHEFDPEEECAVNIPERGPVQGMAYTLSIDFRRVSAVVDENANGMIEPTSNDGCAIGMVKHISKVSEMLLITFRVCSFIPLTSGLDAILSVNSKCILFSTVDFAGKSS